MFRPIATQPKNALTVPNVQVHTLAQSQDLRKTSVPHRQNNTRLNSLKVPLPLGDLGAVQLTTKLH